VYTGAPIVFAGHCGQGEPAVVPTTIPFRAVEAPSDEGLASFCGALLLFYSVFALMLLSLTAAEMHFGMYPGSTFWEVFFRTTGIDGECGTAVPLASEFYKESW
jgi:hypothetical protein